MRPRYRCISEAKTYDSVDTSRYLCTRLNTRGMGRVWTANCKSLHCAGKHGEIVEKICSTILLLLMSKVYSVPDRQNIPILSLKKRKEVRSVSAHTSEAYRLSSCRAPGYGERYHSNMETSTACWPTVLRQNDATWGSFLLEQTVGNPRGARPMNKQREETCKEPFHFAT